MRKKIERLVSLDRFNRRLATFGIALVIASVTLSGWFIATGELVTGLSLLLYVVAGTILAAIGVSPAASTGPGRSA